MGQSVAQQEEARQLALLTAAAVRAKLDPEVAVTEEMREQARLAGIRKELIIRTQANLQELVNSSKEFGSALAEAFKGMVLEGKKLDEVIKNLTNRLASRAIDQLFNMMFAPTPGAATTTPIPATVAATHGGRAGQRWLALSGGRAWPGTIRAGPQRHDRAEQRNARRCRWRDLCTG